MIDGGGASCYTVLYYTVLFIIESFITHSRLIYVAVRIRWHLYRP